MSHNIGLNLQPLATAPLTGIGTYTLEIASRLPDVLGDDYICEGHVFDFAGRNHAADRISELLSVKTVLDDAAVSPVQTAHNGKTISADEPVKAMKLHTCRLFPLGAYIRAGALGRVVSYQQLLGSNAQTTVFFNYLRPSRVSGKSIITVYDMVSERFPETMDKRNRRLLRRFLAKSCRKADAIVTISEFSKREIVDCLGVAPEKIHVALCGIDTKVYFPPEDEEERKKLTAILAEKYKISGPYILYLGTLEPRKNVDVLLDAFEILHQRFPELKLVVCGGLGWQYEKTLSHLEGLGLRDSIIRTGFIPEEDKRMLYIAAQAFAFPSIYEGFGLPVAEAMACGTPVVCSDASSLPEVAGDACILCSPSDVRAFADSLAKIYTDPDTRNLMISRMKKAIERFTWEQAAQVYGQVIADVVKSQR